MHYATYEIMLHKIWKIVYLYNMWRSLKQHIGSTCKKSNNIPQHIGVCCTWEYTHNFYNTQQYISQYMNSHYTTFGFILRISVVVCYYSLVLPHLYNTVFGWQSVWLWIHRQQSTESHHVTPALSKCVLFLSVLNNLFKLDLVSSCRLLNYCRGIFSRSDTEDCGFCQHFERETG